MNYSIRYYKTEIGSPITFSEDSITGITFQRENSMIGETLAPDHATFSFTDKDMLYHAWETYTYGDQINIYNNSSWLGMYFVESVVRTGVNAYTVECTSWVGLLVDTNYSGGIYTGNRTVGQILADILDVTYMVTGTYDFIEWKEYVSGGDYTLEVDIEKDLADIPVYGWLPYGSKRDAIQEIMFAYGATMLKTPWGDLQFTFNTAPRVTNVDVMYMGAAIDNITPCTDVYLTEHDYIASSKAEDEVIADFSNNATAFSNNLIIFDKPYQTATIYATDGAGNVLTEGTDYVIAKHPNYIAVSTAASVAFILYGKPYIDNQRVLHKQTGITAREEHNATVTDAHLVNALNSANALDRMAAYYSTATLTDCAIVLDNNGRPAPGEIVSYQDPFGRATIGVIKNQMVVHSSKIKADGQIVNNWLPQHTGNNYDSYLIVTDDADLKDYCDDNNIPAVLATGGTWNTGALSGKRARLVLFSGMQGGPGGLAGNPGNDSKGDPTFITGGTIGSWAYLAFGRPGEPGIGGEAKEAPEGGKSGRYIQTDIAALPASISFTFGDGGTGGDGEVIEWDDTTDRYETTQVATDGADGDESDVTIGGDTLSTANGVDLTADFVNLITGEVLVPLHGERGQSGDRGLDGGPSKAYAEDNSATYDYTTEGKAEGVDGAEGAVGYNLGPYSGKYRHTPLMGGPGSGGGTWDNHSVVPADPQNGQTAHPTYDWQGQPTGFTAYSTGLVEYNPNTQKYSYTGKRGGKGRDAADHTTPAMLKGGASGNVGGSGGGAGAATGYQKTRYVNGFIYEWGRTLGGDPGAGSKGQTGSKGFGLVLYKA